MGDRSMTVYGTMSRINHWLSFLLFSSVLIVGFTLAYGDLDRATRGPIMNMHKATGTVLLLFAAWRVSWRLREGFIPAAPGTPAWQAVASRSVHWGMLVAMLLMPLSGIFMSLTGGRAIDIYGLFSIPAIMENRDLASLLRQVHGLTGWVLTGLIGVHVLAALKHALIDRDGTLGRMLGARA